MKHEKRVHRDVKPSNLLIDSLGQVKVFRTYINILILPIFTADISVLYR